MGEPHTVSCGAAVFSQEPGAQRGLRVGQLGNRRGGSLASPSSQALSWPCPGGLGPLPAIPQDGSYRSHCPHPPGPLCQSGAGGQGHLSSRDCCELNTHPALLHLFTASQQLCEKGCHYYPRFT